MGEGALSRYPNVARWFAAVNERPAVAKTAELAAKWEAGATCGTKVSPSVQRPAGLPAVIMNCMTSCISGLGCSCAHEAEATEVAVIRARAVKSLVGYMIVSSRWYTVQGTAVLSVN